MSEENSTVSQDIVKKSNQKITITDDLGRAIVLKKPKFSDYLDLLLTLGEAANNDAYVKHVTVFSAVISLDGEPTPLKTHNDLQFLIKELEKSENALAEIIKAVNQNFGEKKTAEEAKEHIKK